MTKTKKQKKRMLATVSDSCTGCAGSPVCIAVCPVDGALEYVPDDDAYPFGTVKVDADRCIGCTLCASKGYEGALTEGCPWDAITMVPAEENEETVANEQEAGIG